MSKLNSNFIIEYEVTKLENFFDLPVGSIVYGAGFRSIEFTYDTGHCNTYDSIDDIKDEVKYLKGPHEYCGVIKYPYLEENGLKIRIREIKRSLGKEIAY